MEVSVQRLGEGRRDQQNETGITSAFSTSPQVTCRGGLKGPSAFCLLDGTRGDRSGVENICYVGKGLKN